MWQTFENYLFFSFVHFSEAESRQAVDLSYRKMQSEVKTRDQHIEKLQEALNELQLALETEKDSRALQVSHHQLSFIPCEILGTDKLEQIVGAIARKNHFPVLPKNMLLLESNGWFQLR